MARILGLFPAALIAAREGMSANAFYRELQSLGMAARRSEVLQLYKISTAIVSKGGTEPFAPIGENPAGGRLESYPTKTAAGVLQTVSLTYRDRTTGKLSRTYWSTKTDEGVTREEAMAAAIDAYSEHAESYNQDLIGAVHTSAYNLSPIGNQ
jgi:hypothetical protein